MSYSDGLVASGQPFDALVNGLITVGLTQALRKQSGSWLRSGYTNQA
jgi:hypothetical protein